jgi:hypothetical protein
MALCKQGMSLVMIGLTLLEGREVGRRRQGSLLLGELPIQELVEFLDGSLLLDANFLQLSELLDYFSYPPPNFLIGLCFHSFHILEKLEDF